MKNFFFPAVTILFLAFVTSCNSANDHNTTASGDMSDRAKKNMDNAKAVANMFESGDFSKTSDYIAADAVDHHTPKGEVKGIDSIKAMFDYYGGMMKNAKNEFVKVLADDDYVMMWLKQSWTATKDDPMMNLKAGQDGHMETIEVTKHNADGKITDHWGFTNNGEMMKMMQMMKKGAGDMKSGMMKDSTGKK